MEDIVFPEGAADSYKQEEQALFIEAVLKTVLQKTKETRKERKN